MPGVGRPGRGIAGARFCGGARVGACGRDCRDDSRLRPVASSPNSAAIQALTAIDASTIALGPRVGRVVDVVVRIGGRRGKALVFNVHHEAVHRSGCSRAVGGPRVAEQGAPAAQDMS